MDAVVKWVSGNVGLSLVAALFLLGLVVNFVQTTFYAWYVIAVAAAFAAAAVTGGPLYFYVFLLGMITAFAEIIGKFRDEPLKSLQTPQAVLYHLLNGAISVFALKVYYLTFGEPATQMDQIKAVTTAGFGSMLLMRSKFFNAKVGDQDISFGPEQIIKVFLSFMERAIDRVRAQSRVEFVRTKFTNLRFETVKPYCDSMLDAAQLLDDRKELGQALKDIAGDGTLDTQLKSYRLGFLLLDRMGEDFVSKLIENPPDNLVARSPEPAEGVLYQLTAGQLNFLQGSEDGYRLQTVTVKVGDKSLPAQAFVAVTVRDGLKPSKSYLQTLIDGAREHRLSAAYIARLEQTDTSPDVEEQVLTAFERRIGDAASAAVTSTRS
jgi:hypothetical protein